MGRGEGGLCEIQEPHRGSVYFENIPYSFSPAVEVLFFDLGSPQHLSFTRIIGQIFSILVQHKGTSLLGQIFSTLVQHKDTRTDILNTCPTQGY